MICFDFASTNHITRSHIDSFGYFPDWPKECILLVNFQLNKTNKLADETYKYLKDTYGKLKES